MGSSSVEKEIVVKFREERVEGRCGICGKLVRYAWEQGLALFVDGTEDPVCTTCGAEHNLPVRDCVWRATIGELITDEKAINDKNRMYMYSMTLKEDSEKLLAALDDVRVSLSPVHTMVKVLTSNDD